MITFKSTTIQFDTGTITRYLALLGVLAAFSLILVALLAVLWLVQEVMHAVAEIAHLISITDPLIITSVLVVLALLILSK